MVKLGRPPAIGKKMGEVVDCAAFLLLCRDETCMHRLRVHTHIVDRLPRQRVVLLPRAVGLPAVLAAEVPRGGGIMRATYFLL